MFKLLEQSLTNLDTAIVKVKSKIGRLDQEIRKSIREQVGAGSKGKQSLDQAKKDIKVKKNKTKYLVFF